MRARFQGHYTLLLCAALAAAAFHGVISCGSETTPDGASGPNADGSDDAASNTTSSQASSGSSGDAPPITSLTVDPPSATLTVGTSPQTQTFVARAQPSNQPVAATWTVDNAAPGTIDANGVYTTSTTAGGTVNVTATYQGQSASAVLKVVLQRDLTSGNVPANVASLFDPTGKTVTTSDPKVPSLVYPVSDTMFPQNIYRVLFQWRGKGMPLYQLSFTSPMANVNVYTDGKHATCTKAGTGASCWESDATSWTSLAASNAGQLVTLKIRAVDPASPATLYESPAYTVRFSRDPVPGAIYYWSTTARGVRRGALADAAPANFFTPAEAQGNCVACHTLSRNGKRMAADVGGENLTVVDVSPTAPPPVKFGFIGTPQLKVSSSWATFSPDTSYVVSSKKGVMTLRDGNTGATVGPNNGVIGLGAGVLGMQPDWGPDGKHIVFTRGNTDRGGGTTISWIGVSGTAFGAVEDLVPPTASVEYGYPMFNPTAEYVAFVKGASIEKDGADKIQLVKASIGSTPVGLDRANTLVNDTTVATGIENNMPTWAPAVGKDVQWVAFASLRDYGVVLAPGSTYGSKMQQLWIAAIDVTKLGTGVDPSYPAFRVPFIELDENCHRPFWALDAVKPADGDAGASTFDAGPCVAYGGSCATGVCCNDVPCLEATGGGYTCHFP